MRILPVTKRACTFHRNQKQHFAASLTSSAERGRHVSRVNITGPEAQPQAFEAFLEHTQQQIIQVSLRMFCVHQPVSLMSKAISHSRVQAAEALDEGTHFQHEPWQRPMGSPNPGHGVTAVLEGGTLLEKVHLCPRRCCDSFMYTATRASAPPYFCLHPAVSSCAYNVKAAAQMPRHALPLCRLL